MNSDPKFKAINVGAGKSLLWRYNLGSRNNPDNPWIGKCDGSIKYIKYVPGKGKKRVHYVDGCDGCEICWRGFPEYMEESRTFISILPFLFYTLRGDREKEQLERVNG
ncbi:hypothetical protein ACTFIW_010976 [Dictyostelium discoideum]